MSLEFVTGSLNFPEFRQVVESTELISWKVAMILVVRLTTISFVRRVSAQL